MSYRSYGYKRRAFELPDREDQILFDHLVNTLRVQASLDTHWKNRCGNCEQSSPYHRFCPYCNLCTYCLLNNLFFFRGHQLLCCN